MRYYAFLGNASLIAENNFMALSLVPSGKAEVSFMVRLPVVTLRVTIWNDRKFSA